MRHLFYKQMFVNARYVATTVLARRKCERPRSSKSRFVEAREYMNMLHPLLLHCEFPLLQPHRSPSSTSTHVLRSLKVNSIILELQTLVSRYPGVGGPRTTVMPLHNWQQPFHDGGPYDTLHNPSVIKTARMNLLSSVEAEWALFDPSDDTDPPFSGSFRDVDGQDQPWTSSLPCDQAPQICDLGSLDHEDMTNTSPCLRSSQSSVPLQAKKLHACTLCSADWPKNFKSVNDLDRHMKSVHKTYRNGDRYWKCGVKGCSSIGKWWPRLDNFRTHVIKMHGMQYEPQIGSFCHIFKSGGNNNALALHSKAYSAIHVELWQGR